MSSVSGDRHSNSVDWRRSGVRIGATRESLERRVKALDIAHRILYLSHVTI